MNAATPRLGHRQPRVLAQSMTLGEEGGAKMTHKTWFTIMLGVTALAVWAGFIGIDDISKAPGHVIPGGEAEFVQHQDGGIVSEILVADGDIVEKGQPLIRFDDKNLKAKVQQMEVDRAKKRMLAAQLRALGQGGSPDFSFALPRYKDIAKNELLIFAGLKQLSNKRRRVLSGRVTSMKEKLQNIVEQERTLSKDAGLLEEELKLRQDLFNKGLTPRTLVLEAKKKVDRTQRDIADLAAARKSTAKTLSASRKNSMALISRMRERALDELTIVTAELDSMDKPLEDLKKGLEGLTVSAPVRGVVNGSRTHSLGARVSPGAVVVQVTPLGAGGVIEVRIATADINRVRAGQSVSVRVKATGFNRYGGITGRLLEISPSAFSDEQGVAYYRGIIALDRDHVGVGAGITRLLPGMAVEADIKTGTQTLLTTLLN